MVINNNNCKIWLFQGSYFNNISKIDFPFVILNDITRLLLNSSPKIDGNKIYFVGPFTCFIPSKPHHYVFVFIYHQSSIPVVVVFLNKIVLLVLFRSTSKTKSVPAGTRGNSHWIADLLLLL